jgi:SHS2 domain-containing protein
MDEKYFRIIDHTADIGLIVYGDNLKQLFTHAAYALISLITLPESISANLQYNVKLKANNIETLFIEWLNEIIYLVDTEQVLFSVFEINHLTENRLLASCYGESVDKKKHSLYREIKAATYHNLIIDRDLSPYSARVIFDI